MFGKYTPDGGADGGTNTDANTACLPDYPRTQSPAAPFGPAIVAFLDQSCGAPSFVYPIAPTPSAHEPLLPFTHASHPSLYPHNPFLYCRPSLTPYHNLTSLSHSQPLTLLYIPQPHTPSSLITPSMCPQSQPPSFHPITPVPPPHRERLTVPTSPCPMGRLANSIPRRLGLTALSVAINCAALTKALTGSEDLLGR